MLSSAFIRIQPKTWAIIAFMVLSVIAGGLAQFIYPGDTYTKVDIWFTPVFILIIFIWYRIDTEQRSWRRSPWLNVTVIALSVVALPYYFFRTRGFKGGLKATLIMLLLLFISGVITSAGQYGVYYIFQNS